jgi:predicted aspartyl protease
MTGRIYSYDYSLDYIPAMPVVEVNLSVPDRDEPAITATALVDSGSDGTMIPVDLLATVGARYVGQARIRSVLGGSQSINLYLVSLRIGAFQIQTVQVIANPKTDEVILGRDVLNQLEVTLNGVASMTEIAA